MAEEDIFMDYTTGSSSPINSEPQTGAKMNFVKLGNTLESISDEKNRVILQLRTNSSNRTDTRLKLLHLRKFNRHVANIITEHRKRLNELKDLVDNLNSRLLCQKFEKKHLLDEIKSCLNTKNIFDTIELEPASNELDSTTTNEHDLMIKRLQRELARRQELQGQLLSILQRKQQTESDLQAKKQKIDDLRNYLQSLLKSSKPLIDACGYDLEAFYKKKMAVDESNTASNNIESTNLDLNSVYEKLVSFVADKPEYKLRYFEALESSESSKGEEEEEREFDVEEGRNANIKCAYIHIKLELESIEPVDIFLKQANSNLLLSIQHDLISENASSSWLKSFAELDCQPVPSEDTNSTWLAPSSLQPDSLNFVQDTEAYSQIFIAIKDALQLWSQLQILVQDREGRLEFDRNSSCDLVYNGSLRAQVTRNLITWTSANENDIDLIANLNMIGSKYRSVFDCLQAQLELLQKQQ